MSTLPTPNPGNQAYPSAAYFDAIRRVCSSERFDAYRLSSDDDLAVLARYLWNIELCEALYPALQTCEVVLRNNIHDAAIRAYSTDMWFHSSHGILALRDQAKADEAIATVARFHPTRSTSGHIVAELTFGFWTALLDRRYDRVLWPKLWRFGFPSVPIPVRARHILLRRLEAVRRLRNRVFHHEPVWRARYLQQQYTDLIEVIDWLAPELSMTIKLLDRFNVVYGQDFNTYAQRVEAHLRAIGYL